MASSDFPTGIGEDLFERDLRDLSITTDGAFFEGQQVKGMIQMSVLAPKMDVPFLYKIIHTKNKQGKIVHTRRIYPVCGRCGFNTSRQVCRKL